jgi:hypothetical protein
MNCVQGIINLSQAGPNDGGLVVMKGSAPLFDRFFEENPVSGPTPWRTAKHQDFHPFTEKNLDWYRAQGCELVKVCAEPGDLIMWDSREVHVRTISSSLFMSCESMARTLKPAISCIMRHALFTVLTRSICSGPSLQRLMSLGPSCTQHTRQHRG